MTRRDPDRRSDPAASLQAPGPAPDPAARLQHDAEALLSGTLRRLGYAADEASHLAGRAVATMLADTRGRMLTGSDPAGGGPDQASGHGLEVEQMVTAHVAADRLSRRRDGQSALLPGLQPTPLAAGPIASPDRASRRARPGAGPDAGTASMDPVHAELLDRMRRRTLRDARKSAEAQAALRVPSPARTTPGLPPLAEADDLATRLDQDADLTRASRTGGLGLSMWLKRLPWG